MRSHIRFQARSARFACLITIAVVAACALILAACGGSGGKASPGTIVPPVEQEQSVDIAEILAAPVPDGVEPELWEMLTQELAGQLNARCVTEYRRELPWGILEIWSAKHDDQWFIEWDNTFFHWDGSGNGVADIADLTPIAIYYGQDGDTEPGAGVADYNWNGRVGIEDITPLAAHWGEQCVGFRVERSTTARGAGYYELGTVDYTDAVGKDEYGYNVYRFPKTSSGADYEWHRVVALDELGNVIAMDPMGGWHGSDGGGLAPSFPIQDLEVVSESPPVVTWSSSFFFCDGDLSSAVSIGDTTPILMYLGCSVDETPSAAVADYDGSGLVDMMDLEPIDCCYGESCAGFLVELSVVSPDDGFIHDGYVWYQNYCEQRNEYGFNVWEYEIVSAPESDAYWVRVTPYAYEYEDNLGVPCEAIEMGGEI